MTRFPTQILSLILLVVMFLSGNIRAEEKPKFELVLRDRSSMAPAIRGTEAMWRFRAIASLCSATFLRKLVNVRSM